MLNYDWTQAYHNGPFGATTPPEQFSDYVVGPNDHFNESRFVGVSGEAIYRILSPYTDPIGLAVYTEPTVGRNFFELENKLILQKNFLDDLLVARVQFHLRAGISLPARPLRPASGSSWQEETDVNFDFAACHTALSRTGRRGSSS